MRKTFLLTYLFIIIFFMSSKAVYPSAWLQIENSQDGEKNYIDLDTVRYKERIVSFRTKNIDIKGVVTKMLFFINCKNGTGAIKDIIIYNSDETVLKSYSYKEEKLPWGKIASHSYVNSFRKLLCKD